MHISTLHEPHRLLAIKSNWTIFQSISGFDKPSQHHKCPLHTERNGSFSVWIDEQGIILWKCHGGCGSGTIVDLAASLWKRTPAETIKQLLADNTDLPVMHTPLPKRVVEPVRPVPDVQRLEEFLFQAQLDLISNFDMQEQYMRKKRGLTVEICRALRLGWTDSAFGMKNAWVIPITDENGAVLALKLHSETPTGRKCMYAPFGTEGRHAWATLWPGLFCSEFSERAAFLEYDCNMTRELAEQQAGAESPCIFLCPGELKAAAWIAAGMDAVGITGGESFKWTPATLSRFKHRKVLVNHDEDDAGILFRDNTIEALLPVAFSVASSSLGTKGLP